MIVTELDCSPSSDQLERLATVAMSWPSGVDELGIGIASRYPLRLVGTLELATHRSRCCIGAPANG